MGPSHAAAAWISRRFFHHHPVWYLINYTLQLLQNGIHQCDELVWVYRAVMIFSLPYYYVLVGLEEDSQRDIWTCTPNTHMEREYCLCSLYANPGDTSNRCSKYCWSNWAKGHPKPSKGTYRAPFNNRFRCRALELVDHRAENYSPIPSIRTIESTFEEIY